MPTMAQRDMGLEETAADIESMRIRGAAEIARQAAWALARHVGSAQGGLAHVQAAARAGAKRLAATRPTAVSLRHAVAAVLAPVLRADDAEGARRVAQEAWEAFDHDVHASKKAIAQHGAALLKAGARVLTHCHSSLVVAVLAEAARQGRRVEAWCTETRPFRQGAITAAALAEAGVPVTMVVDSAARLVLAQKGIDHVLVGADTVTRDGAVYNKVGTATVALLAAERGVPVHCAAGFYKFTPEPEVPVEERGRAEVVLRGEVPDAVRVWNPVFDRTAPAALAGFVTESGLRRPAQAVEEALRRIPEAVAW